MGGIFSLVGVLLYLFVIDRLGLPWINTGLCFVVGGIWTFWAVRATHVYLTKRNAGLTMPLLVGWTLIGLWFRMLLGPKSGFAESLFTLAFMGLLVLYWFTTKGSLPRSWPFRPVPPLPPGPA
jgi:hypothetical protein